MSTPLPELAFVPGPRCRRGPTGQGALSGLWFAAKDLIDVAGDQKTSGNPDWRRTHPPAARSAPVIDRLLANGAGLAGKTVTEELAFGLEGENAFYGTPLNPRCPDRLPGGSSSGSASAVASGLVDFALGTDTGGSIRVPSSFCGNFGLRPSHARIPTDGVTPLAPSLDTIGWMARDGPTLARVGEVLLGADAGNSPTRFVVVADAFDLAEAECAGELRRRAHELFGPMEEVRLFEGDPTEAYRIYRAIQGYEAWAVHGPWISEVHPTFAPAIDGRFRDAAKFTSADVASARARREKFSERVLAQVPEGTSLVLPCAPSAALLRDPATRGDTLPFREHALEMSAIAGLPGLPEVALPVGSVDGRPVGLGVVGPRGSDLGLLALAQRPDVARLARG